ncbi:hypothetical protein HDV00_006706 [Rhizophlyctis rosea]|nr:hypothetical protein HDV00_006706 [Rhizophlyctis rosea]
MIHLQFIRFAIFGIASGEAPSATAMIVFRGIQGIGAACTIPNAIALIIQVCPPGRTRDRAMAMFATSGAVGFVVGLIIGGFLTEVGWRWIFHIPAIVAGVMATLSVLCIPPQAPTSDGDGDTSSKPARPSIDVLGAFLSTAALLILVYVLTDGNARGWSSPLILCLLILSIILLASFVYAELKLKDPLMPPAIWSLPNFAASTCVAICTTGYSVNYTYYVTLIFQEVWGYSPLQSAVRFLPMGIVCTLVALVAEKIIFRFNIKLALVGGLLLATGGQILLGFYNDESQYWSIFFPSVLIGISGMASVYTSVTITAYSAVPVHLAGIVGGVLNTAFQFGNGVGLAITTPIATAVSGTDPDRHQLLKGYHAAIWTTVGIIGLGLLVALIFIKVLRAPAADEEVAIGDVVSSAGGEKDRKVSGGDEIVDARSGDTVFVRD